MTELSPNNDYAKYKKWAHERIYGKVSTDRRLPAGLIPYEPNIKKYWDNERAIGVIESNQVLICPV